MIFTMSLKKIIKTIKDHDRFVISTHVNPDPDALCSELALAEFLRKMGKTVFIVNSERVPKRYDYLPGVKSVQCYKKILKLDYDVAIIVDCGELDRIGDVQALLRKDRILINIDHHITNDNFGHLNLVKSDASSTAEVLYDFFMNFRFEMTENIAKNLYIGILTDTGCFRYDNTTAKTHEIVSKLRAYPFDAYDLYRRLYEVIPLTDMTALTKVFSQARLYKGGVVVVELTKDILSSFTEGFDLRDTIFKFFRSFKEAKVFAILTEVDAKRTRVNFRSSDKVNVAALAQKFGGGGHRKASGCLISGNLTKSKNKILKALQKSS